MMMVMMSVMVMTRLGHLGPDTEAGAAEVFSEMVAKCDNFVSVASQDQVCVYQQQQNLSNTCIGCIRR